MIPEQAFERLLGRDECRQVMAAEYETTPEKRFLLVIKETPALWTKQVCPKANCGHTEVVFHDHTPVRGWRDAAHEN